MVGTLRFAHPTRAPRRAEPYARNPATSPRINRHQGTMEEFVMGRYLLLWLLGVPIPILVLIYAFGGLH